MGKPDRDSRGEALRDSIFFNLQIFIMATKTKVQAQPKAKKAVEYSLDEVYFPVVLSATLQGLMSNPAIIQHLSHVDNDSKMKALTRRAYEIASFAMEKPGELEENENGEQGEEQP